VTGTFGGQIPVREVDGRTIGRGKRGSVVQRLQVKRSRHRQHCGPHVVPWRPVLMRQHKIAHRSSLQGRMHATSGKEAPLPPCSCMNMEGPA
jgi:hypothetical protein